MQFIETLPTEAYLKNTISEESKHTVFIVIWKLLQGDRTRQNFVTEVNIKLETPTFCFGTKVSVNNFTYTEIISERNLSLGLTKLALNSGGISTRLRERLQLK